MNDRKQKLLLEQADRRIEGFEELSAVHMPENGWVNTIRLAINMTLMQLGRRMGTSPQNIRALEVNEKNGKITLQSLHELAKALDMELVYGFVPKAGSLERMVEERALAKATEMVNRSAQTMTLEDQATSNTDLERALEERKKQLETEMPRYLWD